VTIDLHYMTDRQERFDLKISKLKILWKQRHLHLTSSTYLWTQHKLVFFGSGGTVKGSSCIVCADERGRWQAGRTLYYCIQSELDQHFKVLHLPQTIHITNTFRPS